MKVFCSSSHWFIPKLVLPSYFIGTYIESFYYVTNCNYELAEEDLRSSNIGRACGILL